MVRTFLSFVLILLVFVFGLIANGEPNTDSIDIPDISKGPPNLPPESQENQNGEVHFAPIKPLTFSLVVRMGWFYMPDKDFQDPWQYRPSAVQYLMVGPMLHFGSRNDFISNYLGADLFFFQKTLVIESATTFSRVSRWEIDDELRDFLFIRPIQSLPMSVFASLGMNILSSLHQEAYISTSSFSSSINVPSPYTFTLDVGLQIDLNKTISVLASYDLSRMFLLGETFDF